MDIIHISAEGYPVAKAGGLGDVVGALPKYQTLLGHSTTVILPFYQGKFSRENKFSVISSGFARLGHTNYAFNVLELEKNTLGFKLVLIDIPGLFDRENIYSYPDDTERFLTFQIAALNWMNQLDGIPDIVHCHDSHTGFIPFMMSKVREYSKFEQVPTIFTIHNGQYQGHFGFDKLHYLPPFHSYFNGLVEWNHLINPLASAIKCAWRVTTVSPSYLDEIGYSMKGMEELLRKERSKSVGILNGIDTEVWNPETDKMLEKNFSIKNVDKGKSANKEILCRQFGLDPSKPLFTFIGRLVEEKGADLLPGIVYNLSKFNPGEQNILILGSGEKTIQNALLHLEHEFKGSYCSYIGFNEKLSHLIYAGADFLLMPSRVEPCGLNQLYALRYGTIPIVRRTGGLRDTILDIGDNGFGICHDQSSNFDIIHSVQRAKKLYENKKTLNKIRKQMMQIDHSWNKAAMDYIELYQSLKL
ncbi:MAG TPA: glycogen synthase [Prolixibacteraceae bacterium]|nr:glycogen synthase [Prolixibacteraceae bacterium]